jgi:cell division protease FtsH
MINLLSFVIFPLFYILDISSSSILLELTNYPKNIFLIILIIFLIWVLADRIFFLLEEKISDEIFDFFDDYEDDTLSEFTGLDENIISISNDTKIKFADVAGNEEAKNELKEVVKFLKDPKNFIKLGASIPKGVLLGGPPGTGKTLLAKAIAGESGTPFLKVSGSQFVELLVGVGAARVRDLFEKARSLKPSIIFIDEIDSIARVRSANNVMGGGNDEREQTLNQILTEMDGFEADNAIVVIAATNRIDSLDPAIKRPGRFDRQITINNPNLKERLAILKVHALGKKFKPQFSLTEIAFRTIGFSGADLANLLNEAAILATRRKKKWITMNEVNYAIDRLVIGLEGKQLIRAKARQNTAFYQMGHAIIGMLINGADKVEKLTLLSYANTQGMKWSLSAINSNQYNSRKIFVQQILMRLAGRAAEEIVNGTSECTVNSQEDFIEMTRTVRIMVLRYAMARLQEFKQEAQQRNLYLLGSDVKVELNNIIDSFTTSFLDNTYHEILKTLERIRPGGERVVDELITFEELSGKEFKIINYEYFSGLALGTFLFENKKSSFSNLLPDELKKSTNDVEENVDILVSNL